MTITELQKHVETQIQNCLCYKLNVSKYITEAVNRTYTCLKFSSNKYISAPAERGILFSVYNSLQYCIFLYWLSKVAYEIDENGNNAEKFYYLNKMMNAVDLFYAVELPDIWMAEHPLGSIMGRARYSDYFFFYQSCTVGGNKGNYPWLGKHVTMYSDSKILGRAKIGNHVILSANTYVKDETIPDNCIVFGQTPNLIIKQRTKEEILDLTSHIWM